MFFDTLRVKIRDHIPNDDAATKLIGLALRNITATRERGAPSRRAARQQFAILYADRLPHRLRRCQPRMDAAVTAPTRIIINALHTKNLTLPALAPGTQHLREHPAPSTLHPAPFESTLHYSGLLPMSPPVAPVPVR